ncbi:class I adenylate-forming enzyme family protein [Pseudarthrobacter sp. P1]|uniref:class I adenylate-forming enzyme family protein n=1 Tax=Pseudarthrobacter sp. P1 TaxID=3418418 RepID=UPI003CF46788
MPYLNKLSRWATERAQRTAVAVGADRLDFAQLAERAAAQLPGTPAVAALCLPNSLDLAVRFTAALAGRRMVGVLDPAWPEAVRSGVLASIASLAEGIGCAEETGGDALVDGPPDSTFLIGLTSGTSSVPKGFRRNRATWQESFERSIAYFGLAMDDVTLAPGSLASSLNLYALAECLYAGTTFHALAEPSVAGAVASVAHDGVTRLVLVPTMAALMARHGLATGASAAGLQSVICAGSALDADTVELLRRWAPQAAIHQYYGSSELGFVAAGQPAPGAPAAQEVPGPPDAVGLPFPGTEVRIRDTHGHDLPAGEPGTIHVRSTLVCGGYVWGDDGHAFTSAGGWSTVHDQGFLDGEGRLHVLGRDSDMILSSGHNVYPHEVEAVLAAAAGVAQVLVVGVADPVRGQRVVAAVLAEPGKTVEAAPLRALGAEHLPPAKRPGRYYRLDALPTTPAGKVSRALLGTWIEGGHGAVHRIF